MRSHTIILGLIVLFVFALTACSGQATTQKDGIVIEEAWARPSPMMAGNGAVYMVIRNTGDTDDALIGARSNIAEMVELHESYKPEMETEGEGGMGNEMMGMRPVDRIEIPAGQSVALQVGGLHVMLMGLTQKLEPGQTITVTLVFEKAGEITVEAEVRAE